MAGSAFLYHIPGEQHAHDLGPLAAVILLTGIVCTSRLIISDHTQKDIYAGLALGFICQLVAAFCELGRSEFGFIGLTEELFGF